MDSELSLVQELTRLGDKQLIANATETVRVLEKAAEEGRKHWVLAFSGGKDSSLVASLIVEMLKRNPGLDVKVDVVYSDTLMELPPFAQNALCLLQHIDEVSTRFSLPIKSHIAVAPIEQRFWFLVLGKGYPPPHNHFRWCTERLKIRPSRQVMKGIADEQSVVLTGVRFGESGNRDARMKGAMCSKDDSECGQGVWINGDSQMGLDGLAPVAHWRTCQVWDYLIMAAIEWGWPFKTLIKLYGDDGVATRFGCWMCTLVKEDKALKSVASHPEWANLITLNTMRQGLLEDGRKEENRIRKPNGEAGRSSVGFRRMMLDKLTNLEDSLDLQLISKEEVQAIQAYWAVEEELKTPYTHECKYWRWKPDAQII